MAALLLFLLSVHGLSTAIAVLKVGRFIREALGPVPVLRDLVKCPPCLSFWIGLTASLWVISPTVVIYGLVPFAPAVDGATACGFSWIAHVAAERMGYGIPDL